jgi:hypothetical protein
MAAGRSVESRWMADLEAHLEAALRNPDPAHGILACRVRMDPPDGKPQTAAWAVDVVDAGVQPGDAETTGGSEHHTRLDVVCYAPHGPGLRDLFWRVKDLLLPTPPAELWSPLVVDVRPVDGGALLQSAMPLIAAPSARVLSVTVRFHTTIADSFAAAP